MPILVRICRRHSKVLIHVVISANIVEYVDIARLLRLQSHDLAKDEIYTDVTTEARCKISLKLLMDS